MLLRDSMVRTGDPSLQVREDEMDHRQVLLGLVRVASKRKCVVCIAELRQVAVASPAVSTDDRARRDVLPHEANKRIGASPRNERLAWVSEGLENPRLSRYYLEPQPSSVDTPFVFLTVFTPLAHFNSANDGSLVVRTAPLAARAPAHVALVDFDGMLTTNWVTLWAHHASAELVEDLECCLIARKPKLSLKLQGRLAGRLRGDEIRTPEPCGKRRVTRVHDGASRQRGVVLAATAAQHNRATGWKAVGFAFPSTFQAGKTIRPSHGFQVLSASLVGWENLLKLGKTRRKAAWVHA